MTALWIEAVSTERTWSLAVDRPLDHPAPTPDAAGNRAASVATTLQPLVRNGLCAAGESVLTQFHAMGQPRQTKAEAHLAPMHGTFPDTAP